MKTRIVTLMGAILMSQSVLSQVFRAPDPNNFNTNYNRFLSEVFDTDCSTDATAAFKVLGAPVDLPEFGMNGKISYDAGVDPEDLNFSTEIFRNAIRNLDMDRLRFPAGTAGNGFQHYGRLFAVSTVDAEVTEYFYLEKDIPYADTVPGLMGLDTTVAYKYYFLPEGTVFPKSYLELGHKTQNSSQNIIDNFAALIDNENDNNENERIAFLSGVTHMEGEGNGNEIVLADDTALLSEYLPNRLRDFISLCYGDDLEPEIKPTFMLRIFDPLVFVASLADSLGNATFRWSPYLESLGFVDGLDEEAYCSMNDTDRDALQDSIVSHSRSEIRRQMVKMAYEVLVQGGHSPDVKDFQAYLNGVANPTVWSNFLNDEDLTNLNHSALEIDFELGNEVWGHWFYRFLFSKLTDCGNHRPHTIDGDLLLSNAHVYGRICNLAIADIRMVFPSAEIGIVSGNRRNNCNWTSAVNTHVTEDFDAWIMHQYSRYDNDPLDDDGNTLYNLDDSFGLPAIESPELDYMLQSPLYEQLASYKNEEEEGGREALSSKPVWFTEYNIRPSSEADSSIYGSWFDMLAKLNLYNQYLGRIGNFQSDNPVFEDVPDVYNQDENLMGLNIEYLMIHTLFSEFQSGFIYAGDTLNFADQGLIAALMRQLTPVENDNTIVRPLIFDIDAGGVTEGVESYGVQNSVGDPACLPGVTVNPRGPTLWGWQLKSELDCSEHRYFLVNSSSTMINLNMGVELSGAEATTLVYNGEDWARLNINPAIIEALTDQVPGFIAENDEFAFVGDTVLNDDFICDSTGIRIPPYSILIVDAATPAPPGSSVTGTETWSDQMLYVNQDLTIESGGSLTLKDITLYMGETTRIVVESGGSLTLDGATLTSCGDTWRGIYAEGSPSGQYNGTAGFVDMKNGSVIEHAEVGFANYVYQAVGDALTYTYGGYITTENSVFRNNQRDAYFKPYTNVANDGTITEDRSRFELTQFLTDENTPFDTPETEAANVRLVLCSGVRFLGCHFEDLRTALPLHDRRTGIRAFSSAIRVQPKSLSTIKGDPDPDYAYNSFIGLNFGIRLYDLGGTNNFSTTVDRATFECRTGILALHESNLKLIDNTFRLTPTVENTPSYNVDYPVGIYLGWLNRDYTVENNHFEPTDDSGLPAAGIVVNTDRGENEELYRNTFDGLTIGVESIDKNRETIFDIDQGLIIACNDFVQNESDIFVTSLTNNDDHGIHPIQRLDPSAPALNTFDISDAMKDNFVNDLEYTTQYWYDSTATVNERPEHVQPPENFQLEAFQFEDPNRCPNRHSNGFVSPYEGVLNLYLSEYNGTTQLIEQMQDGGNTAQLFNVVVLSTEDEAWESYGTLMGEAGYISEPVLEALSADEGTYSLAMLRDVLVANAHGSGSMATIDSILDARIDQMPAYMRQQIQTAVLNLSPLQHLRNTASGQLQAFDRAMQDRRLSLMGDSLVNDSLQVWEQLLRDADMLRYDYALLDLLDGDGRTAEADFLLTTMQSRTDLSGAQTRELQELQGFRTLMTSWRTTATDLTTLDSSQVSVLTNYANSSGRAAAQAQALLLLNDKWDLDLPVLLPSRTPKRLAYADSKPDVLSEGILQVFPNPASDYTSVEYRIDRAFREAKLEVVDMLGRAVLSRELKQDWNTITLPLRNMEGVYLITIVVDGELYRTTKLIVQ